MKIIIDTREQLPLSFTGHETVRCKLDEGDYNIRELEERICIERKSLADFYQSITIDHLRFKKEIQRCIDKNKAIYIFIEGTLMQFYDGSPIGKAEGRYRYDWSPIIIKTRPITLMRIIETMKDRYKIIVIECITRAIMEEKIVELIDGELSKWSKTIKL